MYERCLASGVYGYVGFGYCVLFLDEWRTEINMTRDEILDAAQKCVSGNREQDYGSPENNFNKIAQLWSAYAGYDFDATDVAVMMALLKIARISSGHAKADNWIDLAGYAACGGEIETWET